ncbi:CIC family chloride channel protein [Haloferula luteola]|uniref:CIC family chloride channel protein n=1 Tax=Haloferula luteola TaxID=595692 RepID=A0A840VBI8_9BACT|nr:ClcB-like voltage-gated chloride channel protein [Haloferula luteola]MBB5352914.1 CIC family chloride channel protein [Haloferula luteola]
MREPSGHAAGLDRPERRLVKVRIWLSERIRFSEFHVTLLWAVVIGLAGALTSAAFKEATEWLHGIFTGHHGGYIETFRAMPQWRRVLVPVVGGLLAGASLLLHRRLKSAKCSSDYMEAVVVGEGNLSARASFVKSLSAWFSSSSGASIGREGPLVQLSSVVSSLIGRLFRFPLARKRLLVASGAAAGVASAYNAPVAGAFFVAEIVLGSMAVESLAPLVVSSIIATLATREIYGGEAIYSAPFFVLRSNAEVIPYVVLGIVSGLLAPVYIRLLKGGESLFAFLKLPLPLRLALGGLVVGLLAMVHPEVTGNGRALVFAVLHDPGPWQAVAVVLVFKLLATSATFGSGAVGGVFTPTLFTGAATGYLFGAALAALWPGAGFQPASFGLVGMGAFLAAATGAPVMAIIMLFELTLSDQVILPAMATSVVAYLVTRAMGGRLLYSDALERKGAAAVSQHLAALKIDDLMTADAAVLDPGASFGEVGRTFIQNRHGSLYVVDEDRYRGVIALRDIKPYLGHPDLEQLMIAGDVMHEDRPRLVAGQGMNEALDLFSLAEAERLPVVDAMGRYLGSVTRADVLMFLAGKPRPGEA